MGISIDWSCDKKSAHVQIVWTSLPLRIRNLCFLGSSGARPKIIVCSNVGGRVSETWAGDLPCPCECHAQSGRWHAARSKAYLWDNDSMAGSKMFEKRLARMSWNLSPWNPISGPIAQQSGTPRSRNTKQIQHTIPKEDTRPEGHRGTEQERTTLRRDRNKPTPNRDSRARSHCCSVT